MDPLPLFSEDDSGTIGVRNPTGEKLSSASFESLMKQPPAPNAPDTDTRESKYKLGDIARVIQLNPADATDEAERRTRRTWPDEVKREIIAEYDAAPFTQKQAVLDKNDITSGRLSSWRSALFGNGKFTPENETSGQKVTRLSSRRTALQQQRRELLNRLADTEQSLREVREELKAALAELVGEDDEF